MERLDHDRVRRSDGGRSTDRARIEKIGVEVGGVLSRTKEEEGVGSAALNPTPAAKKSAAEGRWAGESGEGGGMRRRAATEGGLGLLRFNGVGEAALGGADTCRVVATCASCLVVVLCHAWRLVRRYRPNERFALH